MKYHVLFVIFEKAAKFEIVVCCKLLVALYGLMAIKQALKFQISWQLSGSVKLAFFSSSESFYVPLNCDIKIFSLLEALSLPNYICKIQINI